MAGYEDGQGKGTKTDPAENVNPGSSSGLGGPRAGQKREGNNPTTTHFIRVKANEIEHETTNQKKQNIPYAY